MASSQGPGERKQMTLILNVCKECENGSHENCIPQSFNKTSYETFIKEHQYEISCCTCDNSYHTSDERHLTSIRQFVDWYLEEAQEKC